jgi:CO dehydrogenase maturation factor
MKIAISGKGGVGKTLFTSLLAKLYSKYGYSVIAIDADPDANLAATIGVKEAGKIIPIAEMKELVEERTGTKDGEKGIYFKLNPKVDDLPEKYAARVDNIRIMVMGAVKKGGTGCYCPENALLSSLLSHLLIARDEVVLIDMAAGIEHLSRGTAKSVDRLIIVVEPGSSSIETALRINNMGTELGIANISIVGSKIHNEEEKDYIKDSLSGFDLLGFIPYDSAIQTADLGGNSVLDSSTRIKRAAEEIYKIISPNVTLNR